MCSAVFLPLPVTLFFSSPHIFSTSSYLPAPAPSDWLTGEQDSLSPRLPEHYPFLIYPSLLWGCWSFSEHHAVIPTRLYPSLFFSAILYLTDAPPHGKTSCCLSTVSVLWLLIMLDIFVCLHFHAPILRAVYPSQGLRGLRCIPTVSLTHT